MSKKHRKQQQQAMTAQAPKTSAIHAGEYSVIKGDLWKVLYLNLIYLGLLLAVYFTDNKSHYLERIFSKIFHL